MSKQAETIFVTGGSGFLGRQIIDLGKKKNYKVIAPRSRELNIEKEDQSLNYFNDLLKKNIKIDYIIHSAAYYGGIGFNQKYPIGLIDKNCRMALNIFEACKILKPKKIVSVGSACSYPGHLSNNLAENDLFNGRCHESVEPYGFSKRLHLVLQAAYYKELKISSNQIILTNLYGEHDVFHEERSHALPTLIKKIVEAKLHGKEVIAWGTGTPIREFLYVKDAAQIIIDSILFKHDLEPINIGGEEISIKNLINLICDIVDYDPSLVKWDQSKPNGTMRKVLDSEKLSKILPNFKRRDFTTGLKQTIKWYMDNKKEADQRT